MTPWQEEIVIALAKHVRVMSLEQIRRTWWRGQRTGKQRAKESMRYLESCGLVRIRNVFSRPIAQLDSPLFDWHQGQPAPPFDDVASYLRRRARTEAKVMPVVTAETKALRFFSQMEQRTLKLTQVTHDLHVSEMFLHHFEAGCDVYRDWVGEDCLPRPWPLRERPDALLCDEHGQVNRALEYGGEYTVQRLAKLHQGFVKINLPYELW